MIPKFDNWEYLFPTEKEVENFLSGGSSLWGINQGFENQGRQHYYIYSNSLPANSTILEVGFGQGLDYSYLKREGVLHDKHYFGADITESFVKHANNKLDWSNAVKYDGITLPFKDDYFDYSYLRHVFEHQPHYETLLKEIFRVTKKEAFINWFIPPQDDLEDSINFDGYFYHNVYSKPKLIRFIQDNSWSIKEMQMFKTPNSTDNTWIIQHD